jgi:hypothetical protein
LIAHRKYRSTLRHTSKHAKLATGAAHTDDCSTGACFGAQAAGVVARAIENERAAFFAARECCQRGAVNVTDFNATASRCCKETADRRTTFAPPFDQTSS